MIVVNLNGKRSMDNDLCPAIIKDKLAVHVSYNQKIIEHAINNWINSDNKYRKDNKSEAYIYKDIVYYNLELKKK